MVLFYRLFSPPISAPVWQRRNLRAVIARAGPYFPLLRTGRENRTPLQASADRLLRVTWVGLTFPPLIRQAPTIQVLVQLLPGFRLLDIT